MHHGGLGHEVPAWVGCCPAAGNLHVVDQEHVAVDHGALDQNQVSQPAAHVSGAVICSGRTY